jgi:hypothetical protein
MTGQRQDIILAIYFFKKYFKYLLPFPVPLRYAKALRYNKYLNSQTFVQI